jgi:uncharacterized protein
VLIVDTGPLVAAADRSDRYHTASAELLETATGPLVTTTMVVAEVAYLLTRELGGHAEPSFYDAIINGTLTVEPLTGHDWQRIRELVERYADLPLGGTDASLIAIAERLGATRIATLDRAHFSIIRPVHCNVFDLAPAP